jgi:hypothetical protein
VIKLSILSACVILAACSAQPGKRVVEPSRARDTPIGTVLEQFAIQRSYQECETKNLSEEECKKSLDEAKQHLASVNVRIEALLKDPRTNRCDMVRFLGRCEDPGNTLGDLADCLQATPDRGEAINSGRVAFNLDSRGCPTSNRPVLIPPELTGIWSTEATEFRGDVVIKGEAIYFDSDGVGALVSGKTGGVDNIRIIVTMYAADGSSVALDFTKSGKTFDGEILMRDTLDPHALMSTRSGARYIRRSDTVSSLTRQELGLEPRSK